MTNYLSAIRFKTQFNYFPILLIFLCGIINSCQRDIDTPELSKKATQIEIQEVKEWYNTFTFGKAQKATIFNEKFDESLKTSDSEIIPELSLDWSHAIAVKSGKRTIVEVPVYGNFKFGLGPKNFNRNSQNATTTLVVISTATNRSGYFMSVIANSDYQEKVTYIKQPRSFNGSLIYHTLQGQLVAVQKFKEGGVVGIGTPSTNQKLNIGTTPEVGINLVAQTECITYNVYNNWSVCIAGDCVYHSEYVGSYTVCYETGGDTGGGGGSGGGGGGGEPDPQPCIPTEYSTIGPVPMALGYDVNVVDPNTPGTPGPTIPPVPCPEPPTSPIRLREVKITALKPCAQAVYNSLFSLPSSLMANIFSQFNTPSSFGYNWTLKNGPLAGATENADTTDDPATNTVTTTIDLAKYTVATDLTLARTILHEAAHAYLFRLYHMDPNAYGKDYAELIELYRVTHPNDMNAAHHSNFIDSFVQRIAQTLRAYGDSKGYTFSTLLEKNLFYQNMAWGGLQNTQRFKDLGLPITNAISNTLMIEQYGKNLSGTSVSQKGTRLQCP